MKQPWIVFRHNGEELAAERGIPAEEIKISIEDRAAHR